MGVNLEDHFPPDSGLRKAFWNLFQAPAFPSHCEDFLSPFRIIVLIASECLDARFHEFISACQKP
jgi:hypothetical protein